MTVAEEQRISLEEAAKELDVSERTVRTYANHGLKGVKLEHIPRPGKWETSHEAIKRFLGRLAQSAMNEPIPEIEESHEHKRAKLHSRFRRSQKQSSGSV